MARAPIGPGENGSPSWPKLRLQRVPPGFQKTAKDQSLGYDLPGRYGALGDLGPIRVPCPAEALLGAASGRL
jgi:hypothetical protein